MRIRKTYIIIMLSVTLGMPWQAFAQKLLNPSASGGFLSGITASSGGANTSITLAYSIRQLKSSYDHTAITPPSAVSGFTNSSTPLLRVRRDSDNGQLDIGYTSSGMLDTVLLKNFVSDNAANPTASGYVSIWYDQSGNSRDASQATSGNQMRIVNAGVLERNENGIPAVVDYGDKTLDDASGNAYGLSGDRTISMVAQPRAITSGTLGNGAGNYILDRTNSSTALNSIKFVNNHWTAQVRNDAGGGAGTEGSTSVSSTRTDAVMLQRSANVYLLYVNGTGEASTVISGSNSLQPIRISYGPNSAPGYICFEECIILSYALSATDITTLYNSQNAWFKQSHAKSKLLDNAALGGPLSGSSSLALAYSVRQLTSYYIHTSITFPATVSGFTNAPEPLLRVRRSSDNGELDLGYDANGNLDTVKLKNFVSNNGANPTANGFVSVWYDQSGNSYDALQSSAASQPRIVNAGVIEENGAGIPGIATISGSNIADGTLLTPPAGLNRYGITGDRTLNVISFPRSFTNGNINDGAGTYVLDRTSGTGQDIPLTSIKASGSKWGLQIRNDASNIGSSFQGSINIGLSRSDNITAIRSSNTYSLEVNGIVAGSSTLTGTNSMVPVKIGYGSNTGEYIYYGELLLFGSALSTTDRVVLFKNQETYFTLGDYPQWTGAVSTDWNTAGNWSTNDIPTAVSKVTIPSGTARNLTITSGQTTLLAFKLTVNSGATMTIDGNLGIADSLNVDGTVDGTGTITLNGANGQSQYIKGTMCGLTINNTSAVVNASTNITVNGTLTTSSGAVLNLGTNTLTGTLGTITNNGTIRTFNTSSTPLASGKTWAGTGTVEYAVTTGGQTVVTGNYYKMLLSNTSGTQTVSGDIGFPTTGGGLTTTSGGTMDFLTFLFSAPNSGMVFVNNGKIRTACSNAFPVPLDISWGGTFEFYATGFQRVRRGSYTRLYLTNASGLQEIAGNITISDSMTITGSFNTTTFVLLAASPSAVFVNNGIILVGNTFTTPIPAGRTWGGTVNYTVAAGGQTIINGTYNNLTLSNTSGTQSLSGDLTVNGTLTFSGTGKVALGSNTLNINGALSGHTSSRPLVGNGSSNLVIGGSGALGSSLFFDQTTPGTTNRLNDFTYNRASQTITLGNALQVTGTVTPTAGTLATGDALTLASNASGTARIATGSGSYITGSISAERFIPSVARRWRFIASPVSGSTLDDWQNEIYITGTGGAANGFDATTSNQAGAYYYNEATAGEFNANGWVAAPDINTALTAGKGFRIFIRGDRSDAGVLNGNTGTQAAVTMNAVGAANTGNITMPVSYTNSGNTANDGWSFLGNPYPSPIDWNAFHDAGRTGSSPDYSGTDYAHLDAVVYVYDVNNANYSSYNAVSEIGTGAVSGGVIPSGASFWVKASAALPSMIMKEVYKTGATPAAMFKEGPQPAFSLKLSKDAITGDKMIVKYIAEADRNFDRYDIGKLNGEVNISSITEDGSMLTGNCKPFNGLSDSIKLNISVTESGKYSIEAANAKQFAPGKNVYLVDVFAHAVLDLNIDSRYDFTIDKGNISSYGSNRFIVIVGDVKLLETAVSEIAASNPVSIYPALTNGQVTISNHHASNEPVTITITDAAGRQVNRIDNLSWNSNKIELNLVDYKPGTYIITVQSESANTVLKCVKY